MDSSSDSESSNDEEMAVESSSSSTPELHDISWDEANAIFDYGDELSQSPQIKAVIDNDLLRLKELLESGKSVNVNDNQGFTPLHVSIREKKKDIFDYLLTVDNIRIDAESFDGMTPLNLAVKDNEEYYAFELLKRGADVNLAQNSGDTPLHFSINKCLAVSREIIRNGALIDARNDSGETPFFLACDKCKIDHIHMLMFYGADPTVPNLKQILPFTLSLSKRCLEIQEILFSYTFDTDREISLPNIIEMMVLESPFFYKVMEQDIPVFFEHRDLVNLADNLPDIKTSIFRMFIEKYKILAREFFVACNPIKLYKCQYYSEKKSVNFVDFLCMLSETEFFEEMVDRFEAGNCDYSHSLIDSKLSEDSLTKLLFCLLSHGVTLTSYDVNLVYKIYGYGNLFKLLLHQEIIATGIVEDYAETLPISRLICEPRNTLRSILVNPYYSKPHHHKNLSKFFSFKGVLQFDPLIVCQNVNEVLSLKEIARETARKYLIQKYRIQKSVHFFTILKWLPICQVIKEILSYERPIYL